MALTNEAARELAIDIVKAAKPEHVRLRRFVRYVRGQQRLPWLPDNVETEYRDIALKSASNWLELVVRSIVQGLYVDGYGDGTGQAGELWERGWQANGMDGRQQALYRSAGVLGYSHLMVFPTDGGGVWMRPEAATNMALRWSDMSDEWPDAAVHIRGKDAFDLYDDEARYVIRGQQVTVAGHGLGFTPVAEVRWAFDLLGKPMGEVEPVIPIQDRIVDATFTLQMVAKYGAFPQRWIAGIDTSKPLTDDSGNVITDSAGNPLFPTIKAYVDSILTAIDPDTKFGQFAAADLRQYVEALEAHIRHLAAITQTPPHYLLGSLVNLSAEALAAAESGLQRKIGEKRTVLGEGIEQANRAAAAVLGLDDAAQDTSSQVRWRDVESRSMAQAADAILKLKETGLPVEILWKMVPGLSDQDIEEAKRLVSQRGGMDALIQQLTAAAEPNPITATV